MIKFETTRRGVEVYRDIESLRPFLAVQQTTEPHVSIADFATSPLINRADVFRELNSDIDGLGPLSSKVIGDVLSKCPPLGTTSNPNLHFRKGARRLIIADAATTFLLATEQFGEKILEERHGLQDRYFHYLDPDNLSGGNAETARGLMSVQEDIDAMTIYMALHQASLAIGDTIGDAVEAYGLPDVSRVIHNDKLSIIDIGFRLIEAQDVALKVRQHLIGELSLNTLPSVEQWLSDCGFAR